jgi:hypothetical protein
MSLGLLVAALSLQVTPIQPYATVSHPPIDEMSGIVKSRRYADTYWVHNDSGDRPRLFAIRSGGDVIVPPWFSRRDDAGVVDAAPRIFEGVQIDGATNFDWEDIAIDGDTLYIADVGNNGNARRDLGVFAVTEPNPQAVDRSRYLAWYPVAYPDQREFPPSGRWPFDCEAVFALRGKLFFITKHRVGSAGTPDIGANLYRMDTRHTDRVNVLRKVDEAKNLGGWVTAADVSPDGQTLAVLVQAPVQSVWLFSAKQRGDRMLSGPASRFVFSGGRQCEAICWENDGMLIVSNEQRGMFRIQKSTFSPVARPMP